MMNKKESSRKSRGKQNKTKKEMSQNMRQGKI
jgi:hypothetical protein